MLFLVMKQIMVVYSSCHRNASEMHMVTMIGRIAIVLDNFTSISPILTQGDLADQNVITVMHHKSYIR